MADSEVGDGQGNIWDSLISSSYRDLKGRARYFNIFLPFEVNRTLTNAMWSVLPRNKEQEALLREYGFERIVGEIRVALGEVKSAVKSFAVTEWFNRKSVFREMMSKISSDQLFPDTIWRKGKIFASLNKYTRPGLDQIDVTISDRGSFLTLRMRDIEKNGKLESSCQLRSIHCASRRAVNLIELFGSECQEGRVKLPN